MTPHVAIENLERAFLAAARFCPVVKLMIGAAGLTFAVALGVDRRAAGAVLVAERSGKTLSPWVSIATDGTITIMSPCDEMGQGSMTSLPLIIAEELDADWSKVRVVPAPPIDAIYGNPGFGGMMYTAGSKCGDEFYRPLRVFGAQVRRVLLDNAGKKLAVPLEEAQHGAERGRARQVGPASSAMAKSPAFAEVPDKAPEVNARGIEEAERVPAHRQRRAAGGAAGQGQRQRALQHRCAGAEHALTARSCARRWKARFRTRSTTPKAKVIGRRG